MPLLPFAKVQGLGNDFVVVDLRPGRPAAAVLAVLASPPSTLAPVTPAIARALCDRHFGVGADGVLLILPSDHADARMRVLNADGSEAEMCGNGIRCVAKLLYEAGGQVERSHVTVETGAGVLPCELDVAGGRVRAVTVRMGRPRLARGEIPMGGVPSERAVKCPLRAGDRIYQVTAVSMGNPHAVIFVDKADEDLRVLAETYGPLIEKDHLFPKRTNVEFARMRGRDVDLVVWERGVGITLGCGTGACATAVAACLEKRATAGQELAVHLPGGTLTITVEPDPGSDWAAYQEVLMRGPADVVFFAEINLTSLVA
jgi:diaminopimelate epimerase